MKHCHACVAIRLKIKLRKAADDKNLSLCFLLMDELYYWYDKDFNKIGHNLINHVYNSFGVTLH